MKLYKYTSAKYAFEFLRTRELKVTTLQESNDPDEWVPYRLDSDGHDYLADPICRKQFRENVGAKYGFISLSSQMDNNVMWGHYADKFRGIVLEFGLQPQAKIRPVTYQQTRYVLQDAASYKDEEHLELIASKSSEWSYETEWRFFVEIAACKAVPFDHGRRIYLFPPEPNLKLSGIILGPDCPLEFGNVMTELDQWQDHDITIRRLVHDSLTYALRVTKEFHTRDPNNVVTHYFTDMTYERRQKPFTGDE